MRMSRPSPGWIAPTSPVQVRSPSGNMPTTAPASSQPRSMRIDRMSARNRVFGNAPRCLWTAPSVPGPNRVSDAIQWTARFVASPMSIGSSSVTWLESRIAGPSAGSGSSAMTRTSGRARKRTGSRSLFIRPATRAAFSWEGFSQSDIDATYPVRTGRPRGTVYTARHVRRAH